MSSHKNILLFDSACSKCSALAAHASELGADKLRIESLHNPEMQATLSIVLPGWRWQPTLLVIQNGKVKAYVGRGMQLHLIRILGLRKSIHLAAEARKQHVLSQPSSGTRRRLLVFTPILALAALSTSKTIFANAPDKQVEERLKNERQFEPVSN